MRNVIILSTFVVFLTIGAVVYDLQNDKPVVQTDVIPNIVASSTDYVMKDDVFDLKIRESTSFGNVSLRLDRIVGDSRCPSNVNCIQAGFVTTEILVQIDSTISASTISSNEPPKRFGNYQIEITDVLPNKISTDVLSESDYVVSFRIREEL